MYASGTLSGAAYRIRKFKVGATVTKGTLVAPYSNRYGEVIPCTTTAFADTTGLAISTATYSTTQSDDEGVVQVITNPDLVIRAKVWGEAAAAAFTVGNLLTNTSLSAGGTIVTSAIANDNEQGGTLFCLSGANKGQSRRITDQTNAANTTTVTVPFNSAIAVGDTFLSLPFAIGTNGMAVTLTTNLQHVRADVAVDAGQDVAIHDIYVSTDSPYSPAAPGAEIEFTLVDHHLNTE